MKNIIFVVAEYQPYFSAVGTCCFNIAEEMAKGNNVIVICRKSHHDQLTHEDYKGHKIIRVSYWWWDWRLKLNENIVNNNNIAKRWYKMLLFCIKAKEYLQTIFSRTSIKKDLFKAFYIALNNIKEPIDAVIPLCFPMEAVVAGIEFKKKMKRIKLIPYLFDPFVESNTLHRTVWNKYLKKAAHVKIETSMLELSSKVFCANQLNLHFSDFKNHKELITFTEHPLFKKKHSTDSPFEAKLNSKVIITYTGVFDKLIRNPAYLLRTMKMILSECNAELHLYEYGNCEDIIKKYTENSREQIINHGYVTKNKADTAIIKSHILVSVGNIDNTQVPSKIIEYISVYKPIIHFYTFDNDENINILKNYPYSLCLKQEDILLKENVQKCITFITKNKFQKIDPLEIENIYYTSSPKYIADQILTIIDFEEEKLTNFEKFK